MSPRHRILSVLLLVFGIVWLGAPDRAEALPAPCIVCGSTPLVGPGVEGTVSYAVISGAAFAAEVAAHAAGFFGAVPSGTLGPPVLPAATDFVYLYQLVNDGPSADFMLSWSISGGLVGPAAITAGTRLESTLFVDPGIGLISAGPAGAATGLSGGPTVDFENGLGDPTPVPVVPWGACLGSGPAGVQCSDSMADLFAASVVMSGWGETPSGALLDPLWTGSVVWFASPFGPGAGTSTITTTAGLATSGFVPVPVPEASTLLLLALGLGGLTRFGRRS